MAYFFGNKPCKGSSVIDYAILSPYCLLGYRILKLYHLNLWQVMYIVVFIPVLHDFYMIYNMATDQVNFKDEAAVVTKAT